MKLQNHRIKKREKCGVRQNKRESGRAGFGCNPHQGQFAPIDYWTLMRFGQGFNEADLPFVDYLLPRGWQNVEKRPTLVFFFGGLLDTPPPSTFLIEYVFPRLMSFFFF